MPGPIYEGDDGNFLKASRKLGETVVPGTTRPLFAADVEKAAAERRVIDNTIFVVRGRTPVRAREGRGSIEMVLGYKFNDEHIVVYRTESWEKLSTTVDVQSLIEAMDKAGDFSEDEREFIQNWMRETSGHIDLPLLGKQLTGYTKISLSREQKGKKPQLSAVKAIMRRVSAQVLLKQNVDVKGFLTGVEIVKGSVDVILEDLQAYDLDFY